MPRNIGVGSSLEGHLCLAVPGMLSVGPTALSSWRTLTTSGSSNFLYQLTLVWSVGSRVDISFASFIGIGSIFVKIWTL